MRAKRASRGVTLLELLVVMLVVGILAAVLLPKFLGLTKDARIAKVSSLAASVADAMNMLHTKADLQGALYANVANRSSGTVWVNIGGGAQVRIWNEWPDRWWDGIGVTLAGASPPTGGYLSTQPYPYNGFIFYGYGNSILPGGLAGWALSGAPNPGQCSVTYDNNGNGALPRVGVTTAGC